MRRFIPQRNLSFLEITLIPQVLFFLFIFRYRISYKPSKTWMPETCTLKTEKIALDKLKTVILISNVINGIGARTPWKSTCLVKALSMSKMLKIRHIDHKIHIGVTPKLNNQFGAHAWLSVGNEIILGGKNLEGFHEISSFR